MLKQNPKNIKSIFLNPILQKFSNKKHLHLNQLSKQQIHKDLIFI